ncbi:hypothetical protein GC194_05120 [bacterium]|nr:hypothetical protein [bacterium]
MKNYILVIIPVFVFVLKAQSQKVVLEDNVWFNRSEDDNYGANKKHYVNTYMSFGTSFDPNTFKSPVIDLNEYKNLGLYYDFGICYKYKLGNVLSLTSDLSINRNRRSLHFGIVFPEVEPVYNREIWSAGCFALGPRINFDPNRGNAIGTYLDLRIVGLALANSRRKYKEYTPSNTPPVVVSRGLHPDNRLLFGAEAVLGTGNIALKGRYVFNTQTFDQSAIWQYSRYTLSLQIGFN